MDGAETGALSVTEAAKLTKSTVRSLGTLVVAGEVSGFRGPNARSGHCYFSLKDDESSIQLIVWRGTYEKLGFELKDGLELTVHGAFDVYTSTGKLSFVASKVEVSGEGALRQKVAELARRLEREGLMDASRKRRIPAFCSRVCVVTSLSGSVIDDVKRTLARRNPFVQIDVVGCSVQGADAPATIIRALGVAASTVPDCILLVRGGGSFEDLMCFNDEQLARTVAACPVPVVCGIGHEPDTSICDMVCDRRCSTPTAAAESVAPSLDEVVGQIIERRRRLTTTADRLFKQLGQQKDLSASRLSTAMAQDLLRRQVMLEALAERPCLKGPGALLEDRARTLDQTAERLADALPRTLVRQQARTDETARRLEAAGTRLLVPYQRTLTASAAQLDALSPLKVLGRGYAIVRGEDGSVVQTAADVTPGQRIDVMLGHGRVEAEVMATHDDATVVAG